jgi:hypothetical protein
MTMPNADECTWGGESGGHGLVCGSETRGMAGRKQATGKADQQGRDWRLCFGSSSLFWRSRFGFGELFVECDEPSAQLLG